MAVDLMRFGSRIFPSRIYPTADFNWSSSTIGFILSILYYGGLLSFTGGYVVTKIGGATSCALSIMLSGMATILQPIMLFYNFWAFLLCRLLTGFFDGFTKVGMLEVCSKWIPRNEKSKMMSFIISGFNAGVTIVHILCATLAHRYGWPMIFYVTGSISLILSILTFNLVKNQPSEDECISRKELIYLKQTNVSNQTKKTKHPYKRILLSPAIWALLITRFTQFWVNNIMVTCLPLYINDLTQTTITKVGILSSLPNIASIFMYPICGIFLNHSTKFSISTTLIHKILITSALVIIGVLFAISAIISDFTVSLILFVLVQMLLAVVNLTSEIITISIAPNSTSVIAGLNMVAISVSDIISRLATGFMTTNHSQAEWNNCFVVTSCIAFFNGAVFLRYGSSETLGWATPQPAPNQQCDFDSSDDKKTKL